MSDTAISTEEWVKQVISWGSIAYAFGFLVVMLHTWRLQLPVIELLHPVFIWIGLPLAVVAFFFRQIAAIFRERSAEIAQEAKAGWSLAVDIKTQATMDLVAEAIGSLKAMDRSLGLRMGDWLSKTAEPLMQQLMAQKLDQLQLENPEEFSRRSRQLRRIFGVARLTSALFRLLHVMGYVVLLGLALFFYVWELYPQIPQALGGGQSRMVSMVIDRVALPPSLTLAESVATPSSTAPSSTAPLAPIAASTSDSKNTTLMLAARLLYQTKDAYYLKLMDGQTLSIQADAVKSVIWSANAL